ncbi:hypothetical protein [uncultured Treponema sp.]|uniref:hypothetical protein n=1 Tax=uncultured Treponema sp. TaxID=162155 RepID=UPI00261FA8DD|nr:hypothetical protein [uncultured Treponema sp.]
MKFIKACFAFFLISFLFASCMNSVGDSDNNSSNSNSERALLYEEIANTVWFAFDSRLDFLEYNQILYLNYMPDGIKTTKWIQLTGNGTKVVSAKVIWSENIREIGQTSNVSIYIDEYNKVHFECDFFDLTGMDKIEGVEPARFYKDNLPALKADYLSNLAGEYTLSNGWKLQIGAKLSIAQDINHYWFANVLATEYDEKTKTYDLLLAHTSQKDAAGSISPGITGNEPFVTKQGLFWNHCTLTNISGGGWNVKWSSNWYDSPAEALDAVLDMDDTFNGPTETKMHYVFNFYFGVPVQSKDSSLEYWTVERGEWIGAYKEDSDVAKTWIWAEIKSHIPSYTIPEDKIEDYWWYSTNSITSIESSYVYPLKDTTELSLESYDIYLALKDKPKAGDVYVQEGTYSNGNIEVVVTKSSIIYDGKIYQIKNGIKWTDGKNGEPLSYAYLLSDGTQNYAFNIWWYTNNNFAYIKIRAPKEYSNEELPAGYDYSIMNGFTKPANFTRQ